MYLAQKVDLKINLTPIKGLAHSKYPPKYELLLLLCIPILPLTWLIPTIAFGMLNFNCLLSVFLYRLKSGTASYSTLYPPTLNIVSGM